MFATERPLDMTALHRQIRSMIEDAERFIGQLPSEAIGYVFLENGKPVQPDLAMLDRYQRHAGAPSGVWPSSQAISSAMLERYNNR